MIFSIGAITILNSNLATGTATTGSTVGVSASTAPYSPTKDQRNIMVQVTGTWTGTLVIQETVDCVNWVINGVVTPILTGTAAASFTTNGIYTATIIGAQQVRVTASAAMTGSAVVTIVTTGDY